MAEGLAPPAEGIFTGVSGKNHDFGVYDFRNDNLICDNFNYDIRN